MGMGTTLQRRALIGWAGRLRGTAWSVALVFGAISGCGADSHEPPRSPAPAPVETSQPSPVANPEAAPRAVEPAEAPNGVSEPEPPPPAPLPVTASLARGTGSPADDALAAGDKAYDADDFATAEARYRQAMALAPKDAAAIVGLCRVAIAKTKLPTDFNAAPGHPVLERAVTDLRRALRLDASFAPAHVELGRALLMLGKADAALGALRKAVELAPRDPEAHSGLGVALLATGRSDDAVNELGKASELDP